MTTTRFIHTSDLQLGMTRWFLGAEGQPLFDDSRLAAITKLGQLAVDTGSEFIVVAGDVFEANSIGTRVTNRVQEALQHLPVPVYLLPGNHDPLVADNIFRYTTSIPGVHLIDSSEPVVVRDGVEIVGAPWLSKAPIGDLAQRAFSPLEPSETIRVGLVHGQFDQWSNDDSVAGLMDLDFVETKLEEGSLDYVAVGDTHSTKKLSDTGKVWYSGSPETTDFREEAGGGEFDSGNVLVVTIDKSGTTSTVDVKKYEIGQWVFDAISADLLSREDVDAFLQRLRDYPKKERTVIKYSLSGTLSLSDTEYLNQGLDELRYRFANLYERRRTWDLHVIPETEEIESLDLGAVANAAMKELLDHDDEASRDAVHLLFRLARKN